MKRLKLLIKGLMNVRFLWISSGLMIILSGNNKWHASI